MKSVEETNAKSAIVTVMLTREGFNHPLAERAVKSLRNALSKHDHKVKVRVLTHGEAGNSANGKPVTVLPNGTRVEGFSNLANRVNEAYEGDRTRFAAMCGAQSEPAHPHGLLNELVFTGSRN